MKRITIYTLALSMLAGTAQAQSVAPDAADMSKWSLKVQATANYFRTAPAPASRLARIHPGFGAALEYGLSPMGGLGLEVMYNPYGGELSNGSDLNASTLDFMPYYSLNLSNLIAPYRQGFWEKVNIYSETGAGIGFYGHALDNADRTNKQTLVARTGLSVAYRISDRWDLGLESQYRYYDRSDLAGQSIGKGFSEGLVAGVSLRYKFGATNRTHVRNVSLERPSPNNSFNNCLNAAEKRVRDLETNNDRLLAQLEALKNRPAHEAPKVEAPVLSYAIEFDFDSNNLTDASKSTLDAIAKILNSNDVWKKVTIYGNTDSIGTNAYNQGLSERRAQAVKSYLVEQNVNADKLACVGNGEEKPIDTNETEEGRQRNRRVDFGLE